ncbi:MAG: YegP family protein [Castellaniella sp.]|uniref:YegP family protein n=1 Tax=Castellaniella sp. TaxID=1955812 RepID=UPI002A3587BE|nr:YegP family protein [Castellaniella sp.]MDY0310363.1 YegP family protein [Castellaniella sp.]
MSGDYILKRSGEQFMFNLRAGNHQVILSSQRYASKASAQQGIESVRKSAADDARYRRLTAKNGSFYFNLVAANGEIIGSSEMYTTEAARDKGVESVKTNGPTAVVKDET